MQTKNHSTYFIVEAGEIARWMVGRHLGLHQIPDCCSPLLSLRNVLLKTIEGPKPQRYDGPFPFPLTLYLSLLQHVRVYIEISTDIAIVPIAAGRLVTAVPAIGRRVPRTSAVRSFVPHTPASYDIVKRNRFGFNVTVELLLHAQTFFG